MSGAVTSANDRGAQDGLVKIERCLERVLGAGASQADAVLVYADAQEARVRGSEIDFVKRSRERCLGIRALVRGEGGLSSAVTSTSDLDDAAIDRLAEETVTLAKATAPDPAAGLPEGGFATALPELSLRDPGDDAVSVEARIADAKRAEQAARDSDPRIVNSEGSQVDSSLSKVAYGNSGGFLGEYESAYHGLFCEPLAREGEGMQRDYWMTVGRSLAGLEEASAVGRQAAARALRRLGARPIPTCEAPVIFDAVTAASLVGHIASCVSGYSVYRQTSYLADRMGESIASEQVTVIDDGRLPGGLGSKPFDGEGLPTRRTTLVDSGRLQSWLLDSYSARKLGLESTGSASRGASSAPSAGATNMWLEPGESSLDEIIAATERGLLVTELIGMGFNSTTGDYSRGASGLWIEGGEIVHPVEEITIAGNLGDMLRNVDCIGSEVLWRGRIAAPPLRIANMMIAGT